MSTPAGDGSSVTVEATVSHTLFSSQESGWSALRCSTDSGESFAAVGTLPGVRDGDRLRLSGRWVQHPRFGRQLQVESFVHVDPTTLPGIRRYLASGRIAGLGPVLAGRLVDAFGLETLDVLTNHPRRLRQVRGIGRRTAATISSSWVEQRGAHDALVFLAGHGVTPSVAARALHRYGASAIEVVRSTPYRLAQEIRGVGFLTADRIAASVGIPPDAPERLQAGLLHTLEQATDDGHVFLPRSRMLEDGAALLEVPRESLGPALDQLAVSRQVEVKAIPGDVAVYLPRLAAAEDAVAGDLARLLGDKRPPLVADPAAALARFEAESGLQLAERQREAVAAALGRGVVVVTGGPGTGKTTLVRGLVRILDRAGRKVLLAAPTGRAAKRLEEATGQPARTIHRLLEFSPMDNVFNRNRENPLRADLLVVDEVSMLDLELAAALLEAVPAGCRVTLVGDADQLPSVGPGNVLADLIASGVVPVVRLAEVFRQAAESLIVTNAHRVNRGELPVEPRGEDLLDYYFVERDDPEQAAATAVEIATARIPRRFGLDPVDAVQVLSPMHRGELGVAALNAALRAALNPEGPELALGSRSFRLGDKVMQTRNSYELEIFNGDIGRVTGIDTEARTLVVTFDGRPVEIPSDALEDLVLAYSCTIHKAQGSEYPAVVLVLHQQHYLMLQRNLLYTGITRARRLVTIVGSRRALRRAVENATPRQRNSLLADELKRRATSGER